MEETSEKHWHAELSCIEFVNEAQSSKDCDSNKDHRRFATVTIIRYDGMVLS